MVNSALLKPTSRKNPASLFLLSVNHAGNSALFAGAGIFTASR
jgi:hypothetical protein